MKKRLYITSILIGLSAITHASTSTTRNQSPERFNECQEIRAAFIDAMENDKYQDQNFLDRFTACGKENPKHREDYEYDGRSIPLLCLAAMMITRTSPDYWIPRNKLLLSIIDSGVDINARGLYGKTALDHLCLIEEFHGSIHAESVELLLQRGAKTEDHYRFFRRITSPQTANQIYYHDIHQNPAFMIKLLAKNGFDVNQRYPKEPTAFERLFEQSWINKEKETVQAFIEAGADRTKLSPEGQKRLDLILLDIKNYKTPR